MDYTLRDYSILDKKKIARQECRGEKAKYLCEQIRVCEDLCLPLTEEDIRFLAKLSLDKMMRALSKHKKMY